MTTEKQPNGIYRHVITEPTERHYITGYGETETLAREDARKAAFRVCPILCEYLATALTDLQLSDADQACEDEREPMDSGTVYDCPDETFKRAYDECQQFMTVNAAHIETALNELSHDRIGSTFYLSQVGHGVGFTDDGGTECLAQMEVYARNNRCEGLYFGDDGKAYW